MSMARVEAPSLRDSVANAPAARFFWGRTASACFTALDRGTSLGGRLVELAGRSVLLTSGSQLTTALALIELDGCARRIAIFPPDVDTADLGAIIAAAEIDAIVTDDETPQCSAFDLSLRVSCASAIVPANASPPTGRRTEWLLMTSGTTGVPKLVVHEVATLTAAMKARSAADGAAVWGTFYDIRRYGGLQMYLRAVLGGASLVLSNAGEPVADHLERLARHGVTHLSGTPSHWRRALMDPAIRNIAPRYVRLSGEIADQPILDRLRATFPQAAIGHAYASTEAGVAFDVNDGLAGFPAAYVGPNRDGVEMKVFSDGSLRIRSPRAASRYAGTDQALADADGFVDTGDIVERRGERYYFVGRKGGIINVGGQKVHPEEVEAAINRHPAVWASLVRARKSPITGAIVAADVVLKDRSSPGDREVAQTEGEIMAICRQSLAPHKVPAVIRFVPALNVSATGKLVRHSGPN